MKATSSPRPTALPTSSRRNTSGCAARAMRAPTCPSASSMWLAPRRPSFCTFSPTKFSLALPIHAAREGRATIGARAPHPPDRRRQGHRLGRRMAATHAEHASGKTGGVHAITGSETLNARSSLFARLRQDGEWFQVAARMRVGIRSAAQRPLALQLAPAPRHAGCLWASNGATRTLPSSTDRTGAGAAPDH